MLPLARRWRVLVPSAALLAVAPGCGDSPPCPGLPAVIPASWGTIPPGLDTVQVGEEGVLGMVGGRLHAGFGG